MSFKLLLAAAAALALVAGGSVLLQCKQAASASNSGASNSGPVQAAASGAGAAVPPGAVPPGAGPNAAAPIAVTVVVLRAEPLEVLVPATGTLLGRESVELVSELSRRLLRVRAEEGTRVGKGDVLFELDAADLRAELGKLEVQTRLARVTLERTERLHTEGIANQQELDLARTRVEELGAEKQVLEVTLSKTQIRAPFAGTLGLRRVSEGAWLSPSRVLATLQDASTMKLDFTLPERYGSSIRQGESFRFRVEGHSEGMTGKIAAIEPTVDASTRSLLVRGVVDASTGLVSTLIPGSAASIELPLRVDQALLVPSIAIVPGVEGRRVYVVDQGRAKSVLVEVGFRSADRAQLLSGVKADDQVIVTNLLRLREGVPVSVTAEPISPGAPSLSAPSLSAPSLSGSR